MRTRDLELRRIAPDDAGLNTALEEVGMPTSDLAASGGVYFAGVNDHGQAIGYCGYQTLKEGLALIRSCVVPERDRGKGVGAAMMGAMMERLSEAELSDLYLLTMDADPFFERFGFKIISRDDAPDPVRATSQFSLEACDGAVLMRRRPDGP